LTMTIMIMIIISSNNKSEIVVCHCVQLYQLWMLHSVEIRSSKIMIM
jgi:hypothetical protein